MTEKKGDLILQMFDGVEYDKWKFRLNRFLEMKGRQEVIENDSRPISINEDEWNKKIKAQKCLVNSMSNTQLELIITETSAKRMLKKLDDAYLVQSSAVKPLCTKN